MLVARAEVDHDGVDDHEEDGVGLFHETSCNRTYISRLLCCVNDARYHYTVIDGFKSNVGGWHHCADRGSGCGYVQVDPSDNMIYYVSCFIDEKYICIPGRSTDDVSFGLSFNDDVGNLRVSYNYITDIPFEVNRLNFI